VNAIRELTRKWGPTLLLGIALGAPGGWFLSWSIPIGLFVLRGDRRVAAIELDLASIKNRQRRDCEVQLAGIWWMTATSRTNGWLEPPGAQKIIDEGCIGAPVVVGSIPSAALGPLPSILFGTAFAAPRLDVHAPAARED
jgi:hypothetical protein